MSDKPYKDLSELTLMDDYMFGAVMQDPKLAKGLIEAILEVKLRRIEYVEPQKTVNAGYEAHGIRLDLYVEDEAGNICNVEVQTSNKRNLPKRMRYYQSIIDLHILTPGTDFRELKPSYVIFICGYDPYGWGKCVYRFENRCIDEPELPFGDETAKLVLNTKGTSGDISEELRETLRYMDSGTVSGRWSEALEAAVDGVKSSEERRREYMVMMAREMEIRAEGIEIGEAKGRAEAQQEAAEKVSKAFGIPLEKAKEILEKD